jgi:hypothetical protein
MNNAAEVEELSLLIKLHMAQGEKYYINGEKSADSLKIAKALLLDGAKVHSFSN